MKRLTIFLILLSVFACEDKLNQISPNNLITTNFWKTESDFLQGLAAAYKLFRDGGKGYWGVRGVELSNGRGDDNFIRQDVQALYQLSTFTNNPTTNVPSGIFTGCYNAIYRANQVIENLHQGQVSESFRTAINAEAQFIRGVNYFTLAINFGSVPIITKVPKTSADNPVPKSPIDKVWEQIISDFKAAAKDLPVSYDASNAGRATKGAALGFLAKTYVYKKDWEEAEKIFKMLSKPDGKAQSPFTYDLVTNYEDNFLKGTDNNIESLFEIQLAKVGGPSPWESDNANEAQGVTTAQEFAPGEVSGWFEMYPTEKIFREFQKEKTTTGDFDPRMYATLVWDYPGATYYQKPYAGSFPNPYGKSSRIRKYQNWQDANEGNYISVINEKVLRYADILLMYAETLIMNKRPDEAYPLINRIRQRAHLSDLTTGLSAEALMAEIRHQRMIEFYREGLRFYDLRRWGLLQQEISNSDKEGREFYNDKFQYFPIPQDELNTNPAMKQNPPWG